MRNKILTQNHLKSPAAERMQPADDAKDLVRRCERKLGIVFRKKELLLAALSHPSFRNETGASSLPDFQRLEYFGDTILNFLMSEKLFELFPDGNEGLLSQWRAALVANKKVLAKVAMDAGLLDFIRLGRSERDKSRVEKSKILADTFEAVVAAIYLDRGLPETKAFIRSRFDTFFNARFLNRMSASPKNLLQEWVQREYRTLPLYRSELKDGIFTASAEVHKAGKAKGEGKSKKEAEEKAAKSLLLILKRKAKMRPRG